MTVQGTIRGGLVVLHEALQVPDGTPVTVVVPGPMTVHAVSEAEHARRKAALSELLAMPNENPGDPFSGADHNQALYGDSP